jgi:hypothetical protein
VVLEVLLGAVHGVLLCLQVAQVRQLEVQSLCRVE